MGRILVTEKIATLALDRLRRAGHDVDVRTGLDPGELIGAVPSAAALIIRSATQVTAEVIDAAADLVVVGRAGIGLDNVDVAHATDRGVIVVNAPRANAVSAAEHTMALILAQARNIPQAHAALVAGRWERQRWQGVELAGKTLGVIGLGQIGALVAARAQAFSMEVVAFDPYVTGEQARTVDVELVALHELAARADFITLHLATTPDADALVDTGFLGRVKPTVRVINVARGGVVDERALATAIAEGRVAGAALDVFAEEPCSGSPLFGLDGVVVTPHLGASTREAQDKAGSTVAEQVVLALAGDHVPLAVNADGTRQQ